MLSGESAAGKYPVEAVKMQASIALETEKYLPAHAPLEVPADAHAPASSTTLWVCPL